MKHLLQIASDNDIPIVDMKMNGAEEAMSQSLGGRCIIAIDDRKVKSRADYKVKSAHELGHCITGSFYDERYPVIPRGRLEQRADIWAILNTIPRRPLMKALRQGMTEVWQLAEHFNVTEEFIVKALRYYDLWNGS